MRPTPSRHLKRGLVPQRQKASDYDNSYPVPQLQKVSPLADTTVPLQQELDLLFGPLYDEFFNTGTSRVNKSSSPTDNSDQQDTHPSTNIHPTSKPSTSTNVHAEENNDNQADDTEHEFTNPFCIPVQEVAESSSHNIDVADVTVTKLTTIVKIRSLKYLTSSRTRHSAEHMLMWVPLTWASGISKGSGFKLTTFSNVDHAGCIDTRKSTSGGIQFLGGSSKLNLPDHRYKRRCCSLTLTESDSLPRAHAQTTKTYQDSRIKKAQVLNTKTSANSDIQDLP
ncbi:hypothetical protein Tco_0760517 [Tanacetum coccineum]